MEIFSYVLDGELTHRDSMGSSETLYRGSVQYMSAGTGVRHSEFNTGDTRSRFLQVWYVVFSAFLELMQSCFIQDTT